MRSPYSGIIAWAVAGCVLGGPTVAYVVSTFPRGLTLPSYPAPVWLSLGCIVAFTVIFVRVCQGGMMTHRAWPITVAGMCVYTALVLVTFARIFTLLGIHESDGSVTTETGACLYFSAVTFTTLGYGDLHPTAIARPIAATEALFGYLFLGALIAVVSKLLTQAPDK